MQIVLLAPLILLLSACQSTPNDWEDTILDANMAQVENCQFIKTFHGTSSWGGLSEEHAVHNAKLDVLEQVGQSGGTHVVWKSTRSSIGATAVGDGYSCRSLKSNTSECELKKFGERQG